MKDETTEKRWQNRLKLAQVGWALFLGVVGFGGRAAYDMNHVSDLQKRLDESQKEVARLTNERDNLVNRDRTLIDPSEFKQCQSDLAEVKANKNDVIEENINALYVEHMRDEMTMHDLMDKKWRSQAPGLSEADQIIYLTAEQRWTKYPDDRAVLLKELSCVR